MKTPYPESMKICIHQMRSGINPEINAENMIDAISRAGIAGAVFYFAPEMSLLLDRDRKRAGAKIFAEPETYLLRALCDAAKRAAIWVHLGSIAVVHEDGSGRLANRTLVIDDMGIIRARYDKIHMFDVDLSTGEKWRESTAYRPGEEMSAVQTPWGLLGLAICYDLRFSHMFGAFSGAGVDMIAIPAAFTTPTGEAHWETLLRARAIETQSFVIAAAQTGTHEDGRSTYGHSLVVGPWGDIVADMGDEPGLTVVELDMAQLQEVRSQIPTRKNTRPIPKNVSVV